MSEETAQKARYTLKQITKQATSLDWTESDIRQAAEGMTWPQFSNKIYKPMDKQIYNAYFKKEISKEEYDQYHKILDKVNLDFAGRYQQELDERKKAKEAKKARKNNTEEENQESEDKESAEGEATAEESKQAISSLNDLYTAGRNMVDKKLDEFMMKEVEAIQKQFGISDESKQRIFDIISAYKSARLSKEDILFESERQARVLLENYINREMQAIENSQAGKALQKAHQKLGQLDQQISAFETKWENIANMSNDELSKLISQKLATAINACDKLEDISKKIDDTLGKIGIPGVNFASAFEPIITQFRDITGVKLSEQLKPFIQKQVGVIKQVSEIVKKVDEAIQRFEQQVRDMVEKWKNAAMDWLKEQETKLITEIASKIKISF